MTYKSENVLEHRRFQSNNIIVNNLGYLPLIIESFDQRIKLPKKKYAVSAEIKLYELLARLDTDFIKLDESKKLECRINNIIPDYSYSILKLYKKYKDIDGFLYIQLIIV